MPYRVIQGTLVLTDQLVPNGQVVIEDGVIQHVVTDGRQYEPTDDYRDDLVLPGLIDVHVHGIAGFDVMDGTEESFHSMARWFVRHGVTGFLPTTLTQDLEMTRQVVTGLRRYIEAAPAGRAQVLGIHLEGPFINRAFKGMQNEAYILPPEVEIARDLLACGGGYVRRVSLAPEVPGAEAVIQLLRDAGIYVSIAHTGASYEEALEAVNLGATHVTHCFNAMTGLHHRRPGVVGAAMLCDELYAELIPDGIHIHPAVMRLLIRLKGRARVMLVTDAMSATDMADGVYHFGGHEVTVQGGIARLRDGTLASSTVTMEAAVRNLVQLCGVSLVDAAYMASSTPADALGLGGSKGKLKAGYDADLAVLDAALRTRATWVGGERCFLAGVEA